MATPPPLSIRRLIVGAMFGLLGCTEPAPPPYTRLGGVAPAIDGLPVGPTLLVLWSTWCPPRREELASLRAPVRALPQGIATPLREPLYAGTRRDGNGAIALVGKERP